MFTHVSKWLFTLGISMAFAAASSAAPPRSATALPPPGNNGPWQLIHDSADHCEASIPSNWSKTEPGTWSNPDGRSGIYLESTTNVNGARKQWDTSGIDAKTMISENEPLGRLLIGKIVSPRGEEYRVVFLHKTNDFACSARVYATDRNEAAGLDKTLLTIARSISGEPERRGPAALPVAAIAAYNGPWQVVQDAGHRCETTIPSGWVAGKSAEGYWKNPDGRSSMTIESTDGNQARAQWDTHKKDPNFLLDENKPLGRVLIAKLTSPTGGVEYMALYVPNDHVFSCLAVAVASDRNEAAGLDQTLLTIAKNLNAVAQQRKGVPAPPPLPGVQGAMNGPLAGGRMQPLFDNTHRCEASIPATWVLSGPGIAGERNEAAGIFLDAKNDINMARKQWDQFVDPHSLLANTQTVHIGKQKDNGDGETYLVLILVPGKPFACSALVQVAKTKDVPRYDATLQAIAKSVHSVQ